MNPKQKFNYIIYHNGCIDGFTGYVVAHLSNRLTDDVIIYEDVPSANKIPSNIDGKDIVIIDVAYKKEVLEIIFQYAKSVVFIDHHDSIKNDVIDLYNKYNKSNNIMIVYDDRHSGATLAWSYFFPDKKVPLFVKYVEDQDIGKWEYPSTRPFILALRTYYKLRTDTKTISKWMELLDKAHVMSLVKKGGYMQKYNDHIVSKNVPKHTLESFPSKRVYDMNPAIFKHPGQYKVAVYCGHNCPSVTDLGVGALERMPDIDFCIMWVYNLDSKKYVLSLRSRSVDIGEICKIFGGGGHKLAAAFSFYSKDMFIDELFEGPSLPRTI